MTSDQITSRLSEVEAEHKRAILNAKREAYEDAAEIARGMLVFADTTCTADREIPAAIRAKAKGEQ
ncbi:hypothetical protein [Pelagibacterium lentulum]|nr:hypothetical protein [Pelagibacterium lentulum]